MCNVMDYVTDYNFCHDGNLYRFISLVNTLLNTGYDFEEWNLQHL